MVSQFFVLEAVVALALVVENLCMVRKYLVENIIWLIYNISVVVSLDESNFHLQNVVVGVL